MVDPGNAFAGARGRQGFTRAAQQQQSVAWRSRHVLPVPRHGQDQHPISTFESDRLRATACAFLATHRRAAKTAACARVKAAMAVLAAQTCSAISLPNRQGRGTAPARLSRLTWLRPEWRSSQPSASLANLAKAAGQGEMPDRMVAQGI